MTRTNVRGGAELRKRVNIILTSKRKKYTCPRSGKKVKRISNSIWASQSGEVYAGGTYSFTTSAGVIFTRMLKEIKRKAAAKK